MDLQNKKENGFPNLNIDELEQTRKKQGISVHQSQACTSLEIVVLSFRCSMPEYQSFIKRNLKPVQLVCCLLLFAMSHYQ